VYNVFGDGGVCGVQIVVKCADESEQPPNVCGARETLNAEGVCATSDGPREPFDSVTSVRVCECAHARSLSFVCSSCSSSSSSSRTSRRRAVAVAAAAAERARARRVSESSGSESEIGRRSDARGPSSPSCVLVFVSACADRRSVVVRNALRRVVFVRSCRPQ